MNVGTPSSIVKVCVACGRDVAAMQRHKDADGHYYCHPCHERLVTSAGGDAQLRYNCNVCGGRFPADGVYDDKGRIVCVGCWNQKQSPPPAQTQAPAASRPVKQLLHRVTCPHCWHAFLPGNILWVSRHAELLGDPVLGSDAAARFLPTRINLAGEAIDARGMPCQLLACPRCHLIVPRALTLTEPLFVSIIGVPASGKSYYLTAMTWELRRLLPSQFGIVFQDADTMTNRSLNEYEETLFLQADANRLVAIRKTELQGELYDQIRLGQQVMSLPRPFLFTLRPTGRHPMASAAETAGRVMCLYDNAGEHFQPGMDTVGAPVTQHLAKSRALMFLYDPTQDPRFRHRCTDFSHDPQLNQSVRTHRQETVLIEAAARIRQYTGLSPDKKYERPLVVIVAKSDVWAPLLDVDITSEPIMPLAVSAGGLSGLDVRRVEDVSHRVRRLLQQLTPEFVAAAEDFSKHVVYIPCSALGGPPEVQEGTGMLGIRAKDIRPRWVAVPLLYMYAKWATGLIGIAQPKSNGAKPQPAPVVGTH